MSARDIMTAQYATASDPSSGGRQMPGHYGSPRAQHRVGQLAGRDPAAPRGRDRPGGQDPQDRPGRDDQHGRGLVQPGRRPRGPQLRGDPQAAVRVRRREQRLRDQRAGGDAGVRGRRGGPGVGLRHPGRRRRRRGRAGLLRGGARRGRPGSRGRRTDADRGQGDPADRALVGRPADQVPLRPRSSTAEKGHDALPRFRAQLRDAGVLTDEIEARLTRRDRRRRRGRDRLRRGRARPGSRDRRCGTSTTMRPSTGEGTSADGRSAHVHRGHPRDARRRDAPRRVGHRAGRGRRQEGRRVPGHRRPVGRVRRRPGHRHPADRIDDRRGVDRGRGQRPAAGGRDPVRRLHLPGLQPDRVRGGPDALSLEQRLRRADDDPGAVRRRRPRRALPLAVGRGVLHPRARSQGGRAVHSVRCPGAPALVDPRRGPGAVLRAQEDVPLGPGRRPRHGLHRAPRQGQGHPPGLAGHGRGLRSDGPLRARGGGPRGRGRDQRRGRGPAHAPPAGHARRSSTRCARPASAWSSTRTTSSVATGRRSPRSSPRRRSTTSMGRSPASRAPRSRACPTTTSSRTGSWSTPRRSPTRSERSRPTNRPRSPWTTARRRRRGPTRPRRSRRPWRSPRRD